MALNLEQLEEKLPLHIRKPDPSIYLSENYIALDFETTNLDFGDPHNPNNRLIMSIYQAGKDHPMYEELSRTKIVIGSEYQQHELVEAIEKADYIIAHNAKFELGWLRRCGLDINQVLTYCTQIGDYVLAGNRRWRLSLDECLHRRGLAPKVGCVSSLLKGGVCPSMIPLSYLLKYAQRDVDGLLELFEMQRSELDELKLLPVHFTRNIFTVPLVDMEGRGMCLDEDRVRTVHLKYASRLAELTVQLDEITGGANPKSTKQMREVIFKQLKFRPPRDHRKRVLLTPKGAQLRDAGLLQDDEEYDYYAVNEEAISKMKATTKKQRKFIELKREVSKLRDAMSKSLDKFVACCSETDDKILTAQINQTITQTHRTSSSGKNYKAQFQNFPRIFKPLFRARFEGWDIGEIDEAQLEFRSAAFQAQDPVAMTAIEDNFDVHSDTASILNEIDFDEFIAGKESGAPKFKDMRQDAKADTFKPLYGGKSGTPAQERYYKYFREKYNVITETQEGWVNEVLRTKQLRTPSGLIFYWPDTRQDPRTGYVSNTTNICNYPVQSFATAEVVPIAVTYQYHLMKAAELQSFLVNTIHDSSIGEVHPEEKEEFAEIGNYAFTQKVLQYLDSVYSIDFNVPLEADCEFNENWSDSGYWRDEYLG